MMFYLLETRNWETGSRLDQALKAAASEDGDGDDLQEREMRIWLVRLDYVTNTFTVQSLRDIVLNSLVQYTV